MFKTAAIIMATLLLLPAITLAKQNGGIELTTRAEVEVVQKGAQGEKLVQRVEASTANVAPGDTVIYIVTYLNNGDDPATDVAINNPVPEHMVYVDKSAEGKDARIDFSVDKGKSYAPLSKLKIENSKGMERPARPADVTNVRWILERPVKAGETGSVSYRAKVK